MRERKTYEKPALLDLSLIQGDGANCFNGSGATNTCSVGTSAVSCAPGSGG